MKTRKITFFVSTILLSLMMLFSAGMYIFNNVEVSKIFTALGYPTYIIYPLATAKLLGLAAIWTNYSEKLKQWAYAGFFFDFLLAMSAHLSVADGEWPLAFVAILLLLVSYLTEPARQDTVGSDSDS